jgi:Ca-activated chloride channel family protein
LELRMIMGNCGREAIIALMLVAGSGTAIGAEEANKPCVEDAMIVFDASGSMAGSLAEGIGATIRRIDEVRKALAQVLPNAAHFRRIGLVTYGPQAAASTQRRQAHHGNCRVIEPRR